MFVCGFKRFCLHVCLFLLRCLRMSLSLDPPIRGGDRLVSELFLGFVSVFVFELSAVYVPITWIYNMNHVKIGAV